METLVPLNTFNNNKKEKNSNSLNIDDSERNDKLMTTIFKAIERQEKKL